MEWLSPFCPHYLEQHWHKMTMHAWLRKEGRRISGGPITNSACCPPSPTPPRTSKTLFTNSAPSSWLLEYCFLQAPVISFKIYNSCFNTRVPVHSVSLPSSIRFYTSSLRPNTSIYWDLALAKNPDRYWEFSGTQERCSLISKSMRSWDISLEWENSKSRSGLHSMPNRHWCWGAGEMASTMAWVAAPIPT